MFFKEFFFRQNLYNSLPFIMHEVSDLRQRIVMWSSNNNLLSRVTPRSFSLLELSIADPFIYIVTGLCGERKKWHLDPFVLKLSHWNQSNSFSIVLQIYRLPHHNLYLIHKEWYHLQSWKIQSYIQTETSHKNLYWRGEDLICNLGVHRLIYLTNH